MVWTVFFRLFSPLLTTFINDILLFVDFDVHGLDHVLGLSDVVLGLEGVFQSHQSFLDNIY